MKMPANEEPADDGGGGLNPQDSLIICMKGQRRRLKSQILHLHQDDDQKTTATKAKKTPPNRDDSVIISSLFESFGVHVDLHDPNYHVDDELVQRDAAMRPAYFNKAMNRVAFVLGVLDLIAIVYLMSAKPLLMPYYYTMKLIPLVTMRFVTYSKKSMQYFLLDFCYFVSVLLLFLHVCFCGRKNEELLFLDTISSFLSFPPHTRTSADGYLRHRFHTLLQANAAVLLYLWVFYDSAEWFLVCFGVTAGPVFTAVILFRNSLVFHSMDKITSLHIHTGPMLVLFCIRWNPEFKDRGWKSCVDDDCTAPFFYLWWIPSLFFLSQQFVYLFCTQFVCRKQIESDPNSLTVYKLIFVHHRGFLWKAIHMFGHRLRVLTFGWLYVSAASFLMIPSFIYYRYHTAMAAFLGVVVFIGIYNGANFYFMVFASEEIRAKEKPKRHKVLVRPTADDKTLIDEEDVVGSLNNLKSGDGNLANVGSGRTSKKQKTPKAKLDYLADGRRPSNVPARLSVVLQSYPKEKAHNG
jgi:hypothetical protein